MPLLAVPRRSGADLDGRSTGGRRRPGAVVLLLGGLAAAALVALVQVVVLVLSAQGARASLLDVQSSLERGDVAAAAEARRTAAGRLDRAQRVSAWWPLAAGRSLPAVGGTFDDVDRLLGAARSVHRSTGPLLALAELNSTGDGLFSNGRFDLDSLAVAAELTRDARADVAQARALVDEVSPDWYEPGLRGVRDGQASTLRRGDELLASAGRLLAVLPRAVGGDGTRRYLVTVLNTGELRFSGGAPLTLAQVEFSSGAMSITRRGATFDLTAENAPVRWRPVPDDVWLRAGPDGTVSTRLVNATFNPDWTTAGEQLLRAYEAQFGDRLDGVLALDPRAMAAVLRTTGPAEVPGYGQLTADNLIRTLLVDAYEAYDAPRRRALNEAVFDVMLRRLTSGSGVVGMASALTEASQGRHVLGYFRDPAVARQIRSTPLAGTLPTVSDDVLGVYTQNTNASKVDVFQRRTVEQRVQLRADGGADVRRVVTLVNDTPPYSRADQDPGRGYLTRVSRPFVALHLPVAAERVRFTVDGRLQRLQPGREGQRAIVTTSLTLAGGQSGRIELEYSLPGRGGPPAYALDVTAQPLVRDARFRLEVLPPAGGRLAGSDDDAFVVAGPLTHDRRITVGISPPD